MKINSLKYSIISITVLSLNLFINFLSFAEQKDSTIHGNESHFEAGEEWQLIWADEFEGKSINSNYWTHDVGFGPNDDGWGIWGLQNYTSENSYIRDGKLILKADYNGGEFNGRNYTSAKLTTQGKYSWKYGKIAARIKFPYGKGIFPAFWMLGVNFTTIGWPYCGEIDIAEMFGENSQHNDQGNIGIHYYDDSLKRNAFAGLTGHRYGKDLSGDFHVYSIEWDKENIIFQFDGEEYHRQPINLEKFPNRSEFHKEFYLILNLGIGAYYNEVGYPDEKTTFPKYMEVDWVRIYKRK